MTGSLTPWLLGPCVVLVAVVCWYAGRAYENNNLNLRYEEAASHRKRGGLVEVVTASGTEIFANEVAALMLVHLSNIGSPVWQSRERWFIKLDGRVIFDSDGG